MSKKKEYRRKYNESVKGKLTVKRYNESEKAILARKRYYESEKGKQNRSKFNYDYKPTRLAIIKYQNSEKGKKTIGEYHKNVMSIVLTEEEIDVIKKKALEEALHNVKWNN